MAELVDGPVDVGRLLAGITRPDCGAVAVFLGTTRDRHAGREVAHLFYEAYRPMALAALERIERETVARHGATVCRIAHRLGVVPPAETSVVVAVAAPHRPAAFDGCRWAMERVKDIAPIWKKETYADGGSAWVEGARPA